MPSSRDLDSSSVANLDGSSSLHLAATALMPPQPTVAAREVLEPLKSDHGNHLLKTLPWLSPSFGGEGELLACPTESARVCRPVVPSAFYLPSSYTGPLLPLLNTQSISLLRASPWDHHL